MPDITLIDQPITRQQLKDIAAQRFGDLVKAVVDVARGMMAVGGELHADEEAFLLDQGSQQADLWGITVYPDLPLPDMLEFDSMINIRPSQNNLSRRVEDLAIKQKIAAIVGKLVTE